MMKCQYCDAEKPSARSVQQHELRCYKNPKSLPLWNKGLTKHEDSRLAELAKIARINRLGKKRSTPHPRKGVPSGRTGRSDDPIKEAIRVEKIRKHALLTNLGGYQQGSGRGKKGWYKGIFCDSSWELAYVIFCIDNGIDIKRNITKLPYVWNGKTRNYIPDFLVNAQFVEIKGYQTEQWKAKHSSYPNVKVLYESDMKPILQYVIDKYGKDYISMYEGR